MNSNNNVSDKTLFIKDFRRKRHILYIVLTIVLLIAPFIRLGESKNHIFLLSFDHKVLHLLGIEFNIQEFYVLPFMLIILFVGIFFITVMGGRIWCGWGCPQTIFRSVYRDIIQTQILKLRKKITNKQEVLKLNTPAKKIKYIIGVFLFAIISLIASADFLFFFVPPEDFFSYILDPANHTILLGFWLVITIFMTIEVCFIGETFCIYMCPYARVQSVFFDNDTLMSIYDTKRGGSVYSSTGQLIKLSPKKQDPNNECTNCMRCVQVCPTHIDIRKGVQLECIHCLECVDACSTTMSSLGKPSLVNWSSPNAIMKQTKVKLFRAKTIAYMVILGIFFISLILVANMRTTMLLNITRTAELYMVRQSGAVDNAYKFLIQNIDDREHNFTFEIEGEMANYIDIIIPDYPNVSDFSIPGKSDRTLVVLLRAKESLNNEQDKDRNIPITIKSYATDSKDTISTSFKTFYMYPSQSYIQKKLKN
ncbi:cytochrome c oxidase accessory protein CcoG [Helicobacter muridarum]|uniref:Cytochrome c oxidase accessory protein CcoG n=1 Tax=Helicobacter muridarum TaxID=216 RepID=A0A377PVK0_9HELI|nr:cytochrome c oxidase accessory protein CcoG [Helicobacter muridarum]TLE00842.1 cytochrome c oxidase accessory protein CcoG [Helicobacter muridarum]STQ86607.1 ferredoxin domain-containing integral membrane protein [Helicobacter muridarum]